MEAALGDRAAALLRELKQAQGGSSLPPYNVLCRSHGWLVVLWLCVAVFKQCCRDTDVVMFLRTCSAEGAISLRPSRADATFRLRFQEAQLKKVIQEIHWLYEQNNATIE